MDIIAVRAGLAANADIVQGLRCYANLLDSINPPAFIVAEYEIEFDQTFARGLDVVLFTCAVRVARASERSGQNQLDGYFSGSGGGTLKQALEADKTLGGAAQTLRVERIHSYGQYEVGEEKYFGANIDIRVWGSGS